MKITKSLVIDQNSPEMVELVGKMGISRGMCGYITCALAHFLASKPTFHHEDLKSINSALLMPQMIETIKFIMGRRRLELKKFYKIMSDPQRKEYLAEPVANFEVADYLEFHHQSFLNKQVFFFRHCAYDLPGKVEATKYEERNRIEEQQTYRKELYFFSSFGPYANHFKSQFSQILKSIDRSKPVIIATDISEHFYTTVIFEGHIYILDSLTSYMETENDSTIVECIKSLYIESQFTKSKQAQMKQQEQKGQTHQWKNEVKGQKQTPLSNVEP